MSLINAGIALDLSYTQNAPLQALSTILSKAGTITGSSGFGSSLFLQRMVIGAPITNFTEADFALQLSFPATNQGAGTLSRSLVLYTFGNSTSLGSYLSISSSYTWTTGTSTVAGSTSLSQFQGGWSTAIVMPMTFASSFIAPNEYVVGNLVNFGQGSSTWSISLFGNNQEAISNTSSGAYLSNAGTSSAALLLNAGTAAQTIVTSSTSTKQLTVWTVAPSGSTMTAFSAAPTGVTRTDFTATPAIGGTYPAFQFIGTGSTTSAFFPYFVNGIMSTGAIPTAITLTSTAVTYGGNSTAIQQPWFALIGQ